MENLQLILDLAQKYISLDKPNDAQTFVFGKDKKGKGLYVYHRTPKNFYVWRVTFFISMQNQILKIADDNCDFAQTIDGEDAKKLLSLLKF